MRAAVRVAARLGVVLHGLELSGVRPGGTVAVIGPGPIGLIAMRMARLLGAARIIAVGRGARLEAARQAGADVLVNFEDADPVPGVQDATDGRGVVAAVDSRLPGVRLPRGALHEVAGGGNGACRRPSSRTERPFRKSLRPISIF